MMECEAQLLYISRTYVLQRWKSPCERIPTNHVADRVAKKQESSQFKAPKMPFLPDLNEEVNHE